MWLPKAHTPYLTLMTQIFGEACHTFTHGSTFHAQVQIKGTEHASIMCEPENRSKCARPQIGPNPGPENTEN